MNDTSSLAPPALERAAVKEAARLYREACVLRAQGELEAAASLEAGAVAVALALAESRGDLEPAEWPNLARREEERVAEAHALAGALAPLLAARLPAGVRTHTPAPPAPLRPPATARGEKPAPAPRAVADLIEDMLRMERGDRRP